MKPYLHPLTHFVQPQRIVLVGASERPYSLGERVFSSLLRSPFADKVIPVNPKYKKVAGITTLPNLTKTAKKIDLAIVVTSPHTYEAILKASHKSNIQNVALIQDWAKLDKETWKTAQQQIHQAQKAGLNVCALYPAGISAPNNQFHCSSYKNPLPSGRISILSSHDEFAASIAPTLITANQGVAYHISLNSHISPEYSAKIIDFYSTHHETDAVIVEYQPKQPLRPLLSALRFCARQKPVILHCSHYVSETEAAILRHLTLRSGYMVTRTPSELQAALHVCCANKQSAGTLNIISNTACDWLQHEAEKNGIPIELTHDKPRLIEHKSGYIGSNPGTLQFRNLAEEHLSNRNTEALMAIIGPTPGQTEADITAVLKPLQQQFKKPFIIASAFSDGVLQFRTPETGLKAFNKLREKAHIREAFIRTGAPLPPSVQTPDLQHISTTDSDTPALIAALHLPSFQPNAPHHTQIHLEPTAYGMTLIVKNSFKTHCYLPPFNTIQAEAIIHAFNLHHISEALHQTLHSFNYIYRTLPHIKQLSLHIDDHDIYTTQCISDGQFQAPTPAITPYPLNYSHYFTLRNGQTLLIRPIMPEDAEEEQNFVRNLSEKSRQSRFMAHIKSLNQATLAHFCNLDYSREAAFAAVDNNGTILGIARFSCTQYPYSCEFGISVAENMHGQGLAKQLMYEILHYATEIGYEVMTAEIFKSNAPMLKLAQKLGFTISASPNDTELNDAWLPLVQTNNKNERKNS